MDPRPGFNVVNYYVSCTQQHNMYIYILYVKTHVHRLLLVCVYTRMRLKRGCGMCIEREIKCVPGTLEKRGKPHMMVINRQPSNV